jgi:UDP-N-acetylmuramoyl-L-alanyl-D-glutamate--2,6-diaminopimelate ligase
MAPNAGAMDIVAWLRTHAPAAGARDLRLDSRQVQPGDVFVAVPGARGDGRLHLDAAVARGAAALIVEADGWQAQSAGRDPGVPLLAVPGLVRVLGALAVRYYGQPADRMLTLAVTGTNGKTSCSQWVAQLLSAAGRRCGVIGTLGSGFPGSALRGAELTTPDPVSLQRELRRLLDDGAVAVAMEVSSIGLDQGRTRGMKFHIALFTNLTRDHLDYHGSMERYEQSKAQLFDWPTLTHAVINLDDAAGQRLVQRIAPRCADGSLRVIGYATASPARPPAVAAHLFASDIRSSAQGLAFTVELQAGAESRRAQVHLPLVGQFNVANVLGVFGCALAAGVDFDVASRLLPALAPPPGRMQQVSVAAGAAAPLAVVDYAHTPDALAQALAALRPLATARGGRLWVVFGAGGDRDPGKRAPMGAAAARGADRIVITSDNPRTEDPAAIVAAIAAGLPVPASCERIVERAQAIDWALEHADPADVVLIAGKGHEAYQDIGTRRLTFSDVEHARAALARRCGGHPAPTPPAGSGQCAGAGSPADGGTGEAKRVIGVTT